MTKRGMLSAIRQLLALDPYLFLGMWAEISEEDVLFLHCKPTHEPYGDAMKAIRKKAQANGYSLREVGSDSYLIDAVAPF